MCLCMHACALIFYVLLVKWVNLSAGVVCLVNSKNDDEEFERAAHTVLKSIRLYLYSRCTQVDDMAMRLFARCS